MNLSSLQFNVSQLLKDEIGSNRIYEFASEEPLDLDDTFARNIVGQVKFTQTNFGILATGRASADVDLTCARCLEPFVMPSAFSVEEEFQPEIDVVTGLPSTKPRSETAYSIAQNHIIDLSEAIREQILLTVELVPICKPNCRGLCPSCGSNLNEVTCLCPPADDPSPFAVLQRLLANSEKEA